MEAKAKMTYVKPSSLICDGQTLSQDLVRTFHALNINQLELQRLEKERCMYCRRTQHTGELHLYESRYSLIICNRPRISTATTFATRLPERACQGRSGDDVAM